MIIYIIKISGYSNNIPYPDYWKPYLKTISPSTLETTNNPAFAKIWMRKETAQKNAEKAEKYLKGLHHPHPNIKVEVLEVEFNIKTNP